MEQNYQKYYTQNCAWFVFPENLLVQTYTPITKVHRLIRIKCNKTVVTLLIHEMVKNMINKILFSTLHKFTLDMFSHQKRYLHDLNVVYFHKELVFMCDM